MNKYKVTYELRDSYTVTVDAENEEDLPDILSKMIWRCHRTSAWDWDIKPIEVEDE